MTRSFNRVQIDTCDIAPEYTANSSTEDIYSVSQNSSNAEDLYQSSQISTGAVNISIDGTPIDRSFMSNRGWIDACDVAPEYTANSIEDMYTVLQSLSSSSWS